VAKLMTVERYARVMHLVSSVKGALAIGYDALHALQACLNVGTLSARPSSRRPSSCAARADQARPLWRRDRLAERRGDDGHRRRHPLGGGQGRVALRPGRGRAWCTIPIPPRKRTRRAARRRRSSRCWGARHDRQGADDRQSRQLHLQPGRGDGAPGREGAGAAQQRRRAGRAARGGAERRHIVVSPGPGRPEDAGCSMELIALAKGGCRCSASASAIRRWCSKRRRGGARARRRCTARPRSSSTTAPARSPGSRARCRSGAIIRSAPGAFLSASPFMRRWTAWQWRSATRRRCRPASNSTRSRSSPSWRADARQYPALTVCGGGAGPPRRHPGLDPGSTFCLSGATEEGGCRI
jgi:hypothetical protein